jgi:hypothetical protein
VLIGRPWPAATPVAVAANQKRVSQARMPAAELIPKLEVYADTLTATAPVRVRPVVYGRYVNFVLNGTFEVDASGWIGGVTRDATRAHSGGASGRVVAAGVGDYYWDTVIHLSGPTYWDRFYAWGWVYATGADVGKTISFYLQNFETDEGAVPVTLVEGWQYVALPVEILTTDTPRFLVGFRTTVATTFNFDDIVLTSELDYQPDTAPLLGQGGEYVVPAGWGPGWLCLPFTGPYPAGVQGLDGVVQLGVHAADPGLRVYEQAASYFPASSFNTDAYSDGASATLGATTGTGTAMAVYASTFPGFSPLVEYPSGLHGPPVGVPEMVYARLPFDASQAVFSSTGPRRDPQITARVAWHGTRVNAERGAFAVAQRGGVFDALVGERVRVTHGDPPRSVYVYIGDIAEIDQDLSLSRRAFKALEQLGLDEITATVQVMA